MIISKLKTILTASGCTRVIYESSQLANLKTDESLQSDVIGIILEPDTITLNVKANSIQEQYPPVIVEILQQVLVEASAEDREATLNSLIAVCKVVILKLIADGTFKKIMSTKLTKVLETKYDANLIGWSMPLELVSLENVNNC